MARFMQSFGTPKDAPAAVESDGRYRHQEFPGGDNE
jgi:hypothetical protein